VPNLIKTLSSNDEGVSCFITFSFPWEINIARSGPYQIPAPFN
jgi:hypothetical protein